MKRASRSFIFMCLLFVLTATVAYGESVNGMQGQSFPVGTSVSASTAAEGFVPANVIDKDLSTRWNATMYSGTLQLNFPTTISMSALQIAALATPATDEEYTIYGLKDGLWVQISEPATRKVNTSSAALEPIAVVPGSYEAIKVTVKGNASWVAINEITYIDQTLNAPHLIKMVDGPVYLYWDSVEGATSYEVKRSETSGGPYSVIATVPQAQYPMYRDDDPFNGEYIYKSYYYVVKAINGAKTSADSNEVALIPLSQPLNIRTTAGDSEAKVEWDRVEGATKYMISISTSIDSNYHDIYPYYTDNKATITNLVNGTTYYVRVYAFNDDGRGRGSLPASVTPGVTETDAPTLISISPNFGTQAGEYAVAISGTHFVEGTQVLFNNILATSVFGSDTHLNVIVPSSSVAGFVNVRVLNPDLQSVEMKNGFEYKEISSLPAPTITRLIADNGVLAGGEPNYIDGTNFRAGTQINFDGKLLSTTYVNSTRLVVTVPAGVKPGLVEVYAINPDGQRSSSVNYRYNEPPVVPAPTLTKLIADNGSLAGGEVNYIDGANFKSGAQINFGGKLLATTYVNSTRLMVTVPAGTNPGLVEVYVTNPDGQRSPSLSYRYNEPPVIPAPRITTLSVTNGGLAGGVLNYIDGTGFQSGAQVTFGGKLVVTEFINSTRVRVRVPAGINPGLVEVYVTNPDGQRSSSVNYRYNEPPVIPAPRITTLSVTNGGLAGGELNYIDGTGFQSGAQVNFGGKLVVTEFINSTRVRVRVPAGINPGLVEVYVTNADGQRSSSVSYRYNEPPVIQAPSISSVSPSYGPISGGTIIYIDGKNITSGAKIIFNGTEYAVTYVSSTRVYFNTPAVTAAGIVSFYIINPDGQKSGTLNFEYK
ncbi:IPT/TIG domain-containing protein [Paenibacillus sp. sgz5001063]|uniref:IPT/TIG domain-containing protein n=1 Tax=Paenibacillus sp. sgz5001063 TaxID=3242474 RepID=UPI0036D3ADF8